jgi:hypothetical protein
MEVSAVGYRWWAGLAQKPKKQPRITRMARIKQLMGRDADSRRLELQKVAAVLGKTTATADFTDEHGS